MKIVERDSWLNPVADEVQKRYDRYCNRLKTIEKQFGSLGTFASAHQFFGFHYDRIRRGWWYREWAPAAHYLSLFGDFNDWQRYANPLENVGNGVWEIFLPDDEYQNKLVHGSLLKVIVQSSIGEQERIPIYITLLIVATRFIRSCFCVARLYCLSPILTIPLPSIDIRLFWLLNGLITFVPSLKYKRCFISVCISYPSCVYRIPRDSYSNRLTKLIAFCCPILVIIIGTPILLPSP